MSIYATMLWAGYYANDGLRKVGRDYERITRPLKWNEHGFAETKNGEIYERLKRACQSLPVVPFAIAGAPFSCLFLGLANYFQESRLKVFQTDIPNNPPERERQVRILSLNGCLLESAYSPYCGVVPPFDPVGRYQTRVAAMAHWIATREISPDVFVGQEFQDYRSQEAFVIEMRKYGFCYFILDRAPHPLFVHSGLMVASKRPIGDVSFLEYPYSDRIDRFVIVQQGAIQFTLKDANQKAIMRIINTHLNCGDGERVQEVRARQLQREVVPLFREGSLPTVLIGDFNFDTANASFKRSAGLEGYTNVCEGHQTWTNEGEHHLRGRQDPVQTENVDAILSNDLTKLSLTNPRVEKATTDNCLITDHSAVSATATLC